MTQYKVALTLTRGQELAVRVALETAATVKGSFSWHRSDHGEFLRLRVDNVGTWELFRRVLRYEGTCVGLWEKWLRIGEDGSIVFSQTHVGVKAQVAYWEEIPG